MPLIAHVDMDSFYVAVERRRDPSLVGRPVVVAGRSARGVVASASYEARAFGVKSAMPTAQARSLCPKLIVVEPHGALYSERSREILDILGRLSPVVEPVSIDEAFLDFTGTEKLYGSPLDIAGCVREEVLQATGLSCSVGMASVRHVAKMASRMAKPAGAFWVPPESQGAFLAPLSARDLPGIGPAMQKRLGDLGIHTLGELARRDPKEIARSLGPAAGGLVFRARGEGESTLSPADLIKSIGKETTFESDTREFELLSSALLDICERVASRLRRSSLYARTVTLKLRDSSFKTWSRALTLEAPSQDDRMIFRAVRSVLEKELAVPGKALRLIGVTCSNLDAQREPGQAGLFDAPREIPRAAALGETLDRLRGRFGFDSIRRSAALGAPGGAGPGAAALLGKGALREGLPAGFRGALREAAR